MAEEFALPPSIIDIHNHLWSDPDGSKLIEMMDAHHVAVCVIMGTPGIGPYRGHEDILTAMRKHPGRFVGGVYVDPRDGSKAIDTVRHYHAEGMRIVKLFPNLGYYPDDEAFRPLWDVVAAKGMGVLSHCGWLFPEPGLSYASYYSHPGRFEKVIRIYPQIPFILAHMGGIAGYLETVMLTTRTPNTFVDCSPGQGLLVLEKGGPMVSAIPADRLLYGNDSYDMDAYLPRYRAALAAQGFGPQFPKVFHDNAKAVLEKIGAWPQ